MSPDRRAFLATLAAGVAAPAFLRARSSKKRYPIAFSTLGCPAWSWKTIVEQADALGYAGLELRGVAGEMDLTKVPELTGSRVAETRRDLASRGITIADLGASATMHEREPGARQKQLDEGRRFIDLAQQLEVKYVRMFGDRIPEGQSRDEVVGRVVEGFQQMAAYATKAGVVVLMETHGDFTGSRDVAEIHKRVDSDAFAVLWDAHHTFVASHEQPADSYATLGRWIRHTHLKDSKAVGSERRYVLTGTGEVPVKEQVRVLAAGGYKGYYSFEWEKKWHPEIEEPEVAFPHYARTMGEYLTAAGVQPT
jgi:sugar phosphate isomerase/epimerase